MQTDCMGQQRSAWRSVHYRLVLFCFVLFLLSLNFPFRSTFLASLRTNIPGVDCASGLEYLQIGLFSYFSFIFLRPFSSFFFYFLCSSFIHITCTIHTYQHDYFMFCCVVFFFRCFLSFLLFLRDIWCLSVSLRFSAVLVCVACLCI